MHPQRSKSATGNLSGPPSQNHSLFPSPRGSLGVILPAAPASALTNPTPNVTVPIIGQSKNAPRRGDYGGNASELPAKNSSFPRCHEESSSPSISCPSNDAWDGDLSAGFGSPLLTVPSHAARLANPQLAVTPSPPQPSVTNTMASALLGVGSCSPGRARKSLEQPDSRSSVTSAPGQEKPSTPTNTMDVSALVGALFLKKSASAELDNYFQNRPSNLPPKNPEEAEKQRKMFEAMLKKGRKEEERKQKQQEERERILSHNLHKWQKDIIPHWKGMKDTRRLKELAYQGIPTAVRGTVWELAVGNAMNITPELYQIHRSNARAKADEVSRLASLGNESSFMSNGSRSEPSPSFAVYDSNKHQVKRHRSLKDRGNSVALIELDLSRTYPALAFFRKGGPEHETLRSVLEAYVCYRPDVGYVQGMSFLVSVLLLNMGEVEAFVCFSSLICRPMLHSFYTMELTSIQPYFRVFDQLMEEYIPQLHQHLTALDIHCDLYLMDWVLTLFSKALPLDIATRLWDLVLLFGDNFIMRGALGILQLASDDLVGREFDDVAHYLTHLPDNMNVEKLVQCVHSIDVSERKLADMLKAVSV